MPTFRGTPGNDTIDNSSPDIYGNFPGTGGNDVIDGLEGADTMIGGAGRDFYYVDNSGDVVVDADDETVVNTTINYSLASVQGFTATSGGAGLTLNLRANGITGTGTAGNDVFVSYASNTTMIGGDGSDVMKGGSGSTVRGGLGNDYIEITGSSGTGRLIGGAGDDTYTVDSTSGNLFIDEYSDGGSGIDTVFAKVDFSLSTGSPGIQFDPRAAQIENLTLAAPGAPAVGGPIVGEGNGVANVIIGNRQNNILDGLNGNDTIYGSFGDDDIDGGNDNDSLFGEVGNDTLTAGAGTDTLTGGVGDDIYYIDLLDTVVELVGEGSDTVYTNGSFSTSAEVEFINVTATGTANVILSNSTGTVIEINNSNSANNTFTGGSGNDTMNGKVGIDTLRGNDGADTFAFGGAGLTASGSGTTSIRQDIIIDFVSGQDKIQLDKTNTFGSIVDTAGSPLTDFAFGNFGASNANMDKSSARIVYNLDNGALYYNANGSTFGAGTGGGYFATLTGAPALAASDFIIV
ncbi:calcium-binding protein [Sphaerospermopsis aphanizomenoides BCCUSP55]|uniref:beta strand repeat-containing protein n=1 Tax=Sphaerospermopsis aphanizomenoides TaxID=459663 RepID=UPI001908B513|nr:calcium-binding protein [Sphaerospermopsis aphanizomenoides]MBK1987114.1 calcium-binding protein [Sphaerospermopsis aphanizomenoides BCCUSP55]